MKKLYKLFLVLLITAGATFSCQDGEGAIYTLQDNVDTSGVILRTLEAPLDLVTATGDNNSIDITIEVQEGDGQSAATFVEVRVYQSLYADSDLLEPLVDENGNVITEIKIMTLPASEFGVSEVNGLPEVTIMIPVAEVLAAFPGAVYPVPTFISTRLDVLMPDGTVYTDTNVAATVATGAYFSSPFLYRTIFINS